MTDRESVPDPDGRSSGQDAAAPTEPQRTEQPTAPQPSEPQPTVEKPAEQPTAPDAAEPSGVDPGAEPGAAVAGRRARRAGRIRQQDPASTRPRPPSLGEQRAIAVAQRREDEAREAEEEQAARSRRRLKRIGIVALVVVAVVVLAVVLLAAIGSSNDEVVTASCVDDQGVVVDDGLCDGSAPGAYSGPGGLVILGGNSYRYYYGGTAVPGQVAQGGSTVAPKKADVVTRSGRTIQRGGFGVGGANGGGTSAGTKSGSKSGSGAKSGGKSSSRSGGGRRR